LLFWLRFEFQAFFLRYNYTTKIHISQDSHIS